MTEKGPTTLLTGVIGNRSFGAGFPRAQTLEDSTPISSVVWENGAKDTGSGVRQLWILVQVPVLANWEIPSKLSTLSALSSERCESHQHVATGRAE